MGRDADAAAARQLGLAAVRGAARLSSLGQPRLAMAAARERGRIIHNLVSISAGPACRGPAQVISNRRTRLAPTPLAARIIMSQMLLGFGKRTAESPCLLNPPVKFSKPKTTSRASSKRGVGAEGRGKLGGGLNSE